MEENRATKLISALGIPVRITVRDGARLNVGQDMNPSRVSLEISKGVVVRATYA
jgi:hypothetical protein